MTEEEIKALKVGDEVLIRGKVASNTAGMQIRMQATNEDRYVFYVPTSALHSLAPPRPLEVGDRVQTPLGQSGVIRAIEDGEVWVKFDNFRSTYPLEHLTRIGGEK